MTTGEGESGKGDVGVRARGWRSAINRLLTFGGDDRANVAAMVALMFVPILGIMGLAAEASSWMLTGRAMQNAADAAVIAAANTAYQECLLYEANNNSTTCTSNTNTNYVYTGKAVTSNYGFSDGSGNVSVSVATTTCPTGNSAITTSLPCYKVAVSKTLPIFLVKVVGYNGNSNGSQLITSQAIAGAVTNVPSPLCLLALGTYVGNGANGYAFNSSGGQSINLAGCPVGAMGNMKCDGSNLGAPYGVATGTDGGSAGCGVVGLNGQSITNPYSNLASNVPANTCSTYSLQTVSSTDLSSPGTKIFCGSVTLPSGTNTISGGDHVWVIENGILNMNGATLQTAAESGVVIIFTSPSTTKLNQYLFDNNSSNTPGVSTTYNLGANNWNAGYIAGSGTLNISSPSSGAWKGMTLYQDPTPWPTTGNNKTYNWTYNGASSGFVIDLSGVMYMPNANMTINGAFAKASSGYECFVLVTNTMTSNGGSGNMLAPNLSDPTKQCPQQGVVSPYANGIRYVLVG